MSESKKIGLFCGCFDPIHRGHIRAAETFRSAAGLECVYLVPANVSYRKCGVQIESGLHRLNMCELAAEGHAGIEICDFEIQSQQVPYTIDTILFFQNRFPASKIYLCMGEDTAETVVHWAYFERMKEIVRFLVIERNAWQSGADNLVQSGADVTFVDHERDGISSTEIRKQLMSGKKGIPELDEKVFRYIRANALYGSYT